jgi:hypothetical protein
MRGPVKSTIPLWIVFLLLAGCTGGAYVEDGRDSPPGGPVAQPPGQVDPTLADPFEADLLSLCISESLRPVAETSEQILYDLAAIRSAYGYEALVRTRARTAWTGEIELRLGEMAAREVALGHYPFWRELNRELGPVRVLTLEPGHVILHFGSVFNPCLAAERYAELPGVRTAEPVFDQQIDGPEIFVGFHVHFGYTYLFRDAWGDCMSGCRNEEYYYFRFNGPSPLLVGRWNPADGPPPAWWTEAENEWIACSCPPRLPELPARYRPRTREK